jgi:hypothetical protein
MNSLILREIYDEIVWAMMYEADIPYYTYHVSLVEFNIIDAFRHGGAYCMEFELNNSTAHK